MTTSPEFFKWLDLLARLSAFGIDASDIDEPLDLTEFIELGEHIGCGASADVYRAAWKDPPQLPGQSPVTLPRLAIKVMKLSLVHNTKQREKALKRLKREMAVWQTVQHNNVLRLIGVAYLTSKLEHPSFITLYLPYGTVMDFIEQNPSVPRRPILASIADGLQYLHNHNPVVIHGDLKAANVLIDHKGNPRVSDFGLSRLVHEGTLWETTTQNIAGTARWMAPEFLSQSEITSSKPGDIYAYAMTSYEVMTGQIPYHACRTDVQVLTSVLVHKETPHRPHKPHIPTGLWWLWEQCWSHIPSNRPTISRVAESMSFPTVIASGHGDGCIRIWNIDSGDVRVLEGHTRMVNSLSFSCDGIMLASASHDGVIRVWDVRTGMCIQQLYKNVKRGVIMFSPNGAFIATGSYDGTVRIWDLFIGNEVLVLNGCLKQPVYTVVYSPDGATIAVGHRGTLIRLWDARKGTQIRTLQTNSEWISSLVFSHDNSVLVSGGSSGSVQIWDPTSGTMLLSFSAFECIFGIAIPPNYDVTMFAVAGNSGVTTFDLESGTQPQHSIVCDKIVQGVTFSPDGRTIASRSFRDEAIRIWDADTGSEVKVLNFPGLTSTTYSITFSPM